MQTFGLAEDIAIYHKGPGNFIATYPRSNLK